MPKRDVAAIVAFLIAVAVVSVIALYWLSGYISTILGESPNAI